MSTFLGFLLGICCASSAALSAPKPKIGFVLATMQEERYQTDKKAFIENATRLGAEVIFASCNNKEQTQAAEVENLLSQGVKVLVIQAVNGDAAAGFAKQAKKDGVFVVAYDRLIRNAPLDAFITEDSYSVGKAQAEAAVKFTKGKGNYVLLQGEAGQSGTIARSAGVLDTLKKHPGIHLVVQQTHAGWSPELAMKTTENALTKHGNKIDAVIANNSGMANGAIQALTEQKLTGKVFVAGADADATALRNIAQGKQHLDVRVSIEDQARQAAEVAVALATGKTFKRHGTTDNGAGLVPTMHSPVFPITQGSVR